MKQPSGRQWAVNVARVVASPDVRVSAEQPLAEFQVAGARRLAEIIRSVKGTESLDEATLSSVPRIFFVD